MNTATHQYLLHDIGINGRGPAEDKIFLKYPSIQKNIRRGNTVLEIIDKRGDSEFVMARKGLSKFYDLKSEHINQHRYNEDKDKRDINVRLYTMAPL